MDDHLAAQLCLRDAWPAPETEELGGWQLRAGKGGYNRANSVWAGRFTGEVSLIEAIDRAEAHYRHRGLGLRFQMMDIAQPRGLDAELERRGYRRETPCSDMAKAVSDRAMPTDVSVMEDAGADWLETYGLAQSPERQAELPLILPRLLPQRGFLVCRRNGASAGTALVSRLGSDAAVDCVMTLPDARRTGVARSMLLAAEAWANKEGARRLLLSVVDANAAAMPLYLDLGYRKLAAYHYRFKPA